MLFSRLFSNTILFAACLFVSSLPASIGPEPYLTITSNPNDTRICFVITLFEFGTDKEVGSIQFSFDAATKSAYISRLHVAQEERKKSYGSILLTFTLETLTECGCTVVNWMASPFDLTPGQDARLMLPKLVAFYERHGAQMLSSTGYNANMIYYPNIQKA